MRQTIKKTVALILTVVMLLSMAVTVVNAQESGELKDGDLIKKIDFTQYTWENSSSYTIGTDYDVTATADALTLTSTNLSNKEIGVTAKIDGLTLNEGEVYTIDYSFGCGHRGYGIYMFISGKEAFNSASVGPAISNNLLMLKKNNISTTVGTSQTVNNTKVTTETVENKGGYIDYRNYRIVVDVTNKSMTLYVQVEGDSYYKTTAAYDACDFGGTDFYLTFHAKCGSGYTQLLSDMKIYKGDLMKTTEVDVYDGNSTEKITVTGVDYKLPELEKRPGYVAGWKVNDETTLTPAGTVISTTGLEKITAVYNEVMSDVGVQFKPNENDSSKTDIRIVGVIDSLGYDVLGYNVVIKAGDTQLYSGDIKINTVYESLTATYSANEVKPVTVKDLGYAEGYLTSFAIKGVKEEITIILTPSYTKDSVETKLDSFAITVNVKNKTATKSEVAV